MAKHDQTIGRTYYLLAGLSFVPVLGFFFGLIGIIRGSLRSDIGGRKFTYICLGGIIANIFLLYYPMYVSNKDAEVFFKNKQMGYERHKLNYLSKALEGYKQDYGAYPASQKMLQKSILRGMLDVDENIAASIYYKLTEDGDKYVLLNVGVDNMPFTSDDILPGPI